MLSRLRPLEDRREQLCNWRVTGVSAPLTARNPASRLQHVERACHPKAVSASRMVLIGGSRASSSGIGRRSCARLIHPATTDVEDIVQRRVRAGLEPPKAAGSLSHDPASPQGW